MYALGKQWSVKHIFLALLVAIAVVQSALITLLLDEKPAQAAISCDLVGNVTGPDGSPLSSVTARQAILEVSVNDPGGGISTESVSFYNADDYKILAVAKLYSGSTPGSTTYWRAILDTILYDGAAVQLEIYPFVRFSNNSVFPCQGVDNTGILNNYNTSKMSISLDIVNPDTNTVYNQLDLITNQVQPLAIRANSVTDINDTLHSYAAYTWTPTISGTVQVSSSNKWLASYTAPPTIPTGTNSIKARIEYAGLVLEKTISVNVTAQAVTAPQTTLPAITTPTPTTTTTTPISTTALPIAQAVASRELVSDESECVIAAIGAERHTAIASGTALATAEELTKLKPCFERLKFIIPAAFNPLKDQAARQLETKQDIKITQLTNAQKNVDDVEFQTMVVTGKAKPFQTVLVYIFSEPLVMTTTADADGNWSYELENPLEPGQHEVYAVVDEGDGQYKKSDPWGFIIGRAEASAENPDGYSLSLESVTPPQSNRSIFIYVMVISAVVVAALGIFIWVILKRRNNKIEPNIKSPTVPFDNPTVISPTSGGQITSPPAVIA